MKTMMKKLVASLTAIAIAVLMCVPLTAWGTPGGNNGMITIASASGGATYKVFKIADLESWSGDNYSYKVVDPSWETFLRSSASYVTVSADNYVTVNSGLTASEEAAFAASAYAQSESLTATKSETLGPTDDKAIFTGLDWGYYLVVSSVGTVPTLLTVKDAAGVTIAEKNEIPNVVKTVEEDNGGAYGATNTADIGQVVNFEAAVTAKAGATNYVLHDEMDDGLTFGEITSVFLKQAGVGNQILSEGTDYTLASAITDDCDFEVEFKSNICAALATGDELIVRYTATLNENAKIGHLVGNTNTAWLTHGATSKTSESTTTTYTYLFDLVKTDEADKLLDGAEFELYDAATGGNKINLVKRTNGTYRIATATEVGGAGFSSAVITTTDGQAKVSGIDAGTYYLQEITAPDGYNKLADRVAVDIVDSNLIAAVNAGAWESGGVHVINKTGAELPSTGGMGTTILYIVGGLLVVGAGVALVVRRRSSEK